MNICSNMTRLSYNNIPPIAKHFDLKYLLPFLLLLTLSNIGFTGESVIPLLSGFDRERVAATYPPTNKKTLG